MKKFLLIFLVLIFLPFLNVYSQLTVIDSALHTLLSATGLEQAIYYGKQLADNVEQIENLVKTVENGKQQIEMAAKNLKSVSSIKSWDDFKSWYNRQLYLEKKAMDTFKNMKVKIGKKSYNITDIEGMFDGFNDSYIDYWNKEFTEKQRREMWMELGLTPANYAYVQPFRAKATEFIKQGLTEVDVQNEEYMENMTKIKEHQDKLAEDYLKPEDEQMGDKEIQFMSLEAQLQISKSLSNLEMSMARIMQKKAIEDALNNTPTNMPRAGSWAKDGFEDLTK